MEFTQRYKYYFTYKIFFLNQFCDINISPSAFFNTLDLTGLRDKSFSFWRRDTRDGLKASQFHRLCDWFNGCERCAVSYKADGDPLHLKHRQMTIICKNDFIFTINSKKIIFKKLSNSKGE